MFICSSSPSHGFARSRLIHFLFVCPSMFVSRDVSRSVDYVLPSRLTLPTAGGVKALLVRTRKLGGVRETAHCRRGHGSLRGSFLRCLSLFCDCQYEGSDSHDLSLTVTPEMTGDFPSISLKTSASASSPDLSLYFFLASSPSAVLNSSYVMLRQDFFLKHRWKRNLSITHTPQPPHVVFRFGRHQVFSTASQWSLKA